MEKRHPIGDKEVSIKVINKFPCINETLVAMLNSCVSKNSASSHLEKINGLSEDERKAKVDATFSHSLGKGHNAAGDPPHYILDFENIPRLETLRQARQPRGFDLLQQSTRRVELDSVYKPKCIRDNGSADFLFDLTMNKVLEIYFRMLDSAKDKDERMNLRQDAMFILPLYLQTNNAICGSARGYWQYFTEGVNKGMPELSRKVSVDMLRVLGKENPELFRKWKINYKYEEFYPSNSDFLSKRNIPLENLVKEHKLDRGSKLLGQVNPFVGWSVEDIRKGIVDKDPATYANLVQCKAQFLAKTDLSTYHELFRQRTLDQTVGSFMSAMDNRNKTFFVPDTIKARGFESIYLFACRSLEALYYHLQTAGISKQDAVGVAPHALEVCSLLTIDGWNLIHLSGSRLCSTAKPSMRKWMRGMADELKAANNPLSEYLVPKGEQYGFCPDNHPNGCNICKVRKE